MESLKDETLLDASTEKVEALKSLE